MKGDAHRLLFETNISDAVFSDCTLCLLDKDVAIGEMVRVTSPGGYVGMHDICWKGDAPETLKQRLLEIEGERPETFKGWRTLLALAGLTDIRLVDKPHLIAQMAKDVQKDLGISGQLDIVVNTIKRLGIQGLGAVLRSETIFRNRHMGYGIMVGRKAVSQSFFMRLGQLCDKNEFSLLNANNRIVRNKEASVAPETDAIGSSDRFAVYWMESANCVSPQGCMFGLEILCQLRPAVEG